MNLLLDTHAVIWFLNGDPQLSKTASFLISDLASVRFVSMATIWEIAIKIKTGKLDIEFPINDLMDKLLLNGMIVLPIEFRHVLQTNNLDLHHRDPFDRMIIAQSITEDLTIISKDKNFSLYPIKLLW